MKTEFEVKFYPINKDEFREKLKRQKATLVNSEVKTKAATYNDRANPQIKCHYIRVRDEGNKIRMSAKIHAMQSGKVSDQKEVDTIVDSFSNTVEILEAAGLKRSGYAEKMRETWELRGAEIVIDTWPSLETLIEIEADSEEKVKEIALLLNLNWEEKIITSVVEIYMKRYSFSVEEVLEKLKNTTFDNDPFESQNKK